VIIILTISITENFISPATDRLAALTAQSSHMIAGRLHHETGYPFRKTITNGQFIFDNFSSLPTRLKTDIND